MTDNHGPYNHPSDHPLARDILIGVIVVESQFEIRTINPQALSLLGLTFDQIHGSEPIDPNWRIFSKNGTYETAKLEQVLRAVMTQTPHRSLVVGVQHASDEQRWLLINAVPEFEVNHQLKQVVYTLSDSVTYLPRPRVSQETPEQQVKERTAQLQQALEFEAIVKRLTEKVRDSLDESQILQTAVQELGMVLGVSCCNTALYDLDEGTSTVCYEYTISGIDYWGRVLQMANSPEIYKQLSQGLYFQFCSIIPDSPRNQAVMLACPIVDNQGVLGDLWLVNDQAYAFNESQIRLVQQVANQCAIAIRQARLYQESQSQVKELEKLNRLKDDFLSTVSHELRTPMANMKMAIHMLKCAPDTARSQRYIEILEMECRREVELINDLLDLQRLEADAYQIELQIVNLQEWLPTIVEPFRSRTIQFQQSLVVDCAENLPLLTTDATMLGRILAELLNNACKYTPAKGEIAVAVHCDSFSNVKRLEPQVRAEPMNIVFSIRNQATISKKELPHIFEKFYRIPNHNPWKQGGTGLGLALVKSFVKRLKGNVQATSTEGWTTFTIELPVKPKIDSQALIQEPM